MGLVRTQRILLTVFIVAVCVVFFVVHVTDRLRPQKALVAEERSLNTTELYGTTEAIASLQDDRWVFLLSYQRTGSSFVGKMFSDPDNIFYVYEPLDPLYSAMYGTEDGWTVPSDIFSNRDGTLRDIPRDELHATYWLMEKIYTCDMSSLPPAILAHKFWFVFNTSMTHTSGYLRCLGKHGVNYKTGLARCQRHIKPLCGTRFGYSQQKQDACKNILWGTDLLESLSDNPRCSENRKHIDSNIPTQFQAYYKCLAIMDSALTKCAAEHFDAPCRSKSLRAVKTVRGNMRVADHMLKKHNNLYLIHHFRDPRGAVRSRMKADWSRGLYSKHSYEREATLYCTQVLDDVKRRLELEKQLTSPRIKQLIYDGFAQEPLLNTLDVYNFIGANASMMIKNRYMDNRDKNQTEKSEFIAKRWEKILKPNDIEAINRKCSTLMQYIDFDWTQR